MGNFSSKKRLDHPKLGAGSKANEVCARKEEEKGIKISEDQKSSEKVPIEKEATAIYSDVKKPIEIGFRERFQYVREYQRKQPYWDSIAFIDFEGLSALILSSADPMCLSLKEKMSASILDVSASWALLIECGEEPIQLSIYRQWNTQAVVELCSQYDEKFPSEDENVMLVRLKTQRFQLKPKTIQTLGTMHPLQLKSFLDKRNGICPVEEDAIQESIEESSSEVATPSKDLFVHNLSKSCHKGHLVQVFSEFGKVERCHIPKKHGKASTYAFISMATIEDADNAIRGANGKKVEGSILHVSYSTNNENTKIIVKKIPKTWDEDCISEVFGQFGKILHCKILRDDRTGVSRRRATIRFENEREASQALSLNQVAIPNVQKKGYFCTLKVEKWRLNYNGKDESPKSNLQYVDHHEQDLLMFREMQYLRDEAFMNEMYYQPDYYYDYY